MRNSSFIRSALARVALELAPPLIRETLLEEAVFREEYNLEADAVVHFGDSGVSVQRSALFEAVRKILSGAPVMEVTDIDGRKWELKDAREEGELPHLVLTQGKQNLVLPDFAALSPDSATRLRSLDKAASDVNLPVSARDTWHDVLKERALEDDEVDVFLSEFRDTPVEKARSIRREILGRKQINISSLVPPSRKYFERLVGVYDGSLSIRDYAAGSIRALFDQLCTWRSYDGFLFCLLLSSHSSITAEVKVDDLSSEDLIRAFNFLDKDGDRISQLGAIEVGLQILSSRPEIEPILTHLIEQIYGDDPSKESSGFNLLSALFFLVDGELSRTRLLSAEPPFYRRLAALSQTALIHRQIVNSAIDVENFCKWATSNHGGRFYLQSLVDMRLEPRWNPDYAVASQLKADFIGRIMITVRSRVQDIKDDKLSDFVLANTLESFPSPSDLMHLYLPGALEGTEESQNTLPAEFAEAIHAQLAGMEVSPLSFIALVNSALIFRVGTDQVNLATKALKLGNYRLANVEDKPQLLAILNGLAIVAAVSRSTELANELRTLVRRYRHDVQYALSIEESMKICLVASASHADLNGWREFAGDWLTELAFSDLEGDDGEVFHSRLQYLCHVVPELWVSCGRADAALTAYNARRNSA